MLRWLQVFVLLLVSTTTFNSYAVDTAAGTPVGTAHVIKAQGPIGPAIAQYIEKSMDKAQKADAALIILALDTPGGLDSSMRQIIQAIVNSSIPVATYVSPKGARAASAGTYILYASHIAAMAPATNVGAATPVSLGGAGALPAINPTARDPEPNTGEQADQSTPASSNPPQSAMERKVINDAVAYIRSLAQLRNRNADWAEQAVVKGSSLSAQQALDDQVIDIIATDIDDLLAQINGRSITINGQELTLNTESLKLEFISADWVTQFLMGISNPNIAYIFMMIGIYGLLLEFYNPGSLIAGTVGAISLCLAFYSLQVLPVNYVGVLLILLGVGFMVAEGFAPSFGILGITGLLALVIGSLMLFDEEIPGFGLDYTVIASMTLFSLVTTLATLHFALKARQQQVVSGDFELYNETGYALADFDQTGMVHIRGELWQAQSPSPVKKNQPIKVTAIDGLILHIVPSQEST